MSRQFETAMVTGKPVDGLRVVKQGQEKSSKIDAGNSKVDSLVSREEGLNRSLQVINQEIESTKAHLEICSKNTDGFEREINELTQELEKLEERKREVEEELGTIKKNKNKKIPSDVSNSTPPENIGVVEEEGTKELELSEGEKEKVFVFPEEVVEEYTKGVSEKRKEKMMELLSRYEKEFTNFVQDEMALPEKYHSKEQMLRDMEKWLKSNKKNAKRVIEVFENYKEREEEKTKLHDNIFSQIEKINNLFEELSEDDVSKYENKLDSIYMEEPTEDEEYVDIKFNKTANKETLELLKAITSDIEKTILKSREPSLKTKKSEEVEVPGAKTEQGAVNKLRRSIISKLNKIKGIDENNKKSYLAEIQAVPEAKDSDDVPVASRKLNGILRKIINEEQKMNKKYLRKPDISKSVDAVRVKQSEKYIKDKEKYGDNFASISKEIEGLDAELETVLNTVVSNSAAKTDKLIAIDKKLRNFRDRMENLNKKKGRFPRLLGKVNAEINKVEGMLELRTFYYENATKLKEADRSKMHDIFYAFIKGGVSLPGAKSQMERIVNEVHDGVEERKKEDVEALDILNGFDADAVLDDIPTMDESGVEDLNEYIKNITKLKDLFKVVKELGEENHNYDGDYERMKLLVYERNKEDFKQLVKISLTNDFGIRDKFLDLILNSQTDEEFLKELDDVLKVNDILDTSEMNKLVKEIVDESNTKKSTDTSKREEDVVFELDEEGDNNNSNKEAEQKEVLDSVSQAILECDNVDSLCCVIEQNASEMEGVDDEFVVSSLKFLASRVNEESFMLEVEKNVPEEYGIRKKFLELVGRTEEGDGSGSVAEEEKLAKLYSEKINSCNSINELNTLLISDELFKDNDVFKDNALKIRAVLTARDVDYEGDEEWRAEIEDFDTFIAEVDKNIPEKFGLRNKVLELIGEADKYYEQKAIDVERSKDKWYKRLWHFSKNKEVGKQFRNMTASTIAKVLGVKSVHVFYDFYKKNKHRKDISELFTELGLHVVEIPEEEVDSIDRHGLKAGHLVDTHIIEDIENKIERLNIGETEKNIYYEKLNYLIENFKEERKDLNSGTSDKLEGVIKEHVKNKFTKAEAIKESLNSIFKAGTLATAGLGDTILTSARLGSYAMVDVTEEYIKRHKEEGRVSVREIVSSEVKDTMKKVGGFFKDVFKKGENRSLLEKLDSVGALGKVAAYTGISLGVVSDISNNLFEDLSNQNLAMAAQVDNTIVDSGKERLPVEETDQEGEPQEFTMEAKAPDRERIIISLVEQNYSREVAEAVAEDGVISAEENELLNKEVEEDVILAMLSEDLSKEDLKTVDYVQGDNLFGVKMEGSTRGAEKLRNEIMENIKNSGDVQRSLATVYKDEGILHSIRRQLEANPKHFGFDGKDLSDVEAVKNWSALESYSIAEKAGYVGEDGQQVGVRSANEVAYSLKKEGENIRIEEFKKDDEGIYIDQANDKVAQADIVSDKDREELTQELNNYEYDIGANNEYAETPSELDINYHPMKEIYPGVDTTIERYNANVRLKESVHAVLSSNDTEGAISDISIQAEHAVIDGDHRESEHLAHIASEAKKEYIDLIIDSLKQQGGFDENDYEKIEKVLSDNEISTDKTEFITEGIQESDDRRFIIDNLDEIFALGDSLPGQNYEEIVRALKDIPDGIDKYKLPYTKFLVNSSYDIAGREGIKEMFGVLPADGTNTFNSTISGGFITSIKEVKFENGTQSFDILIDRTYEPPLFGFKMNDGSGVGTADVVTFNPKPGTEFSDKNIDKTISELKRKMDEGSFQL